MTADRRPFLPLALCLPLPAQPDRINGRAFATRYQAIARDPQNGTYLGASESRKDGQAAGY